MKTYGTKGFVMSQIIKCTSLLALIFTLVGLTPANATTLVGFTPANATAAAPATTPAILIPVVPGDGTNGTTLLNVGDIIAIKSLGTNTGFIHPDRNPQDTSGTNMMVSTSTITNPETNTHAQFKVLFSVPASTATGGNTVQLQSVSLPTRMLGKGTVNNNTSGSGRLNKLSIKDTITTAEAASYQSTIAQTFYLANSTVYLLSDTNLTKNSDGTYNGYWQANSSTFDMSSSNLIANAAKFQVYRVTPITSLTSAQLQALTTTQLTTMLADGKTTVLMALSTAQIQAFTNAQVAALSAAQLNTVLADGKTTVLMALSTTQIPALTVAQLGTLTSAQIDPLTSAQIDAMTTAQLNATLADGKSIAASLDTNDLDSLTQSQVQGLTPATVAAQIAKLTPAQLGFLSAAQVAALSVAQIQALTPAQVGGLTDIQLNAMLNDGKTALATALTNTQVKLLTNEQLDTALSLLTPAQIPALTVAQIGTLSADQANMLSDNQADVLTDAQLNATIDDTKTILMNALNAQQMSMIDASSLQGAAGSALSATAVRSNAALTEADSVQPSSTAKLEVGSIIAIKVMGTGGDGSFLKLDYTQTTPPVLKSRIKGGSVINPVTDKNAQFRVVASSESVNGNGDTVTGGNTVKLVSVAAPDYCIGVGTGTSETDPLGFSSESGNFLSALKLAANPTELNKSLVIRSNDATGYTYLMVGHNTPGKPTYRYWQTGSTGFLVTKNTDKYSSDYVDSSIKEIKIYVVKTKAQANAEVVLGTVTKAIDPLLEQAKAAINALPVTVGAKVALAARLATLQTARKDAKKANDITPDSVNALVTAANAGTTLSQIDAIIAAITFDSTAKKELVTRRATLNTAIGASTTVASVPTADVNTLLADANAVKVASDLVLPNTTVINLASSAAATMFMCADLNKVADKQVFVSDTTSDDATTKWNIGNADVRTFKKADNSITAYATFSLSPTSAPSKYLGVNGARIVLNTTKQLFAVTSNQDGKIKFGPFTSTTDPTQNVRFTGVNVIINPDGTLFTRTVIKDAASVASELEAAATSTTNTANAAAQALKDAQNAVDPVLANITSMLAALPATFVDTKTTKPYAAPLQARLATLQAARKNATKAADIDVNACNDLANDVDDTKEIYDGQQNNTQLAANLATSNLAVQTAQGERDNLARQLQSATNLSAQEKQALQDRLDNATANFNTLQSQAAADHTALLQSQADLATATGNLAEKQTLLDQATADRDAARAQSATLDTKLATANQALADAQAAFDNATGAAKIEAQAKLDAANQAATAAAADAQHNKELLADATTKLTGLSNDLAASQQKLGETETARIAAETARLAAEEALAAQKAAEAFEKERRDAELADLRAQLMAALAKAQPTKTPEAIEAHVEAVVSGDQAAIVAAGPAVSALANTVAESAKAAAFASMGLSEEVGPDGGAISIAVGGNAVYSITNMGLYKLLDTAAPNPWSKQPLKLMNSAKKPVVLNDKNNLDSVACGIDGTLGLLDDAGNVYLFNEKSKTFEELAASKAMNNVKFDTLSIGNRAHIWAADGKGNLYQYTGKDWKLALKTSPNTNTIDVAVGGDGTVVRVDKSGDAFMLAHKPAPVAPGKKSGKAVEVWEALPKLPDNGDLDQIAVGSKSNIIAATADGKLASLGAQGWELVGDSDSAKIEDVAVNGAGSIVALDAQRNLWMKPFVAAQAAVKSTVKDKKTGKNVTVTKPASGHRLAAAKPADIVIHAKKAGKNVRATAKKSKKLNVKAAKQKQAKTVKQAAPKARRSKVNKPKKAAQPGAKKTGSKKPAGKAPAAKKAAAKSTGKAPAAKHAQKKPVAK